MIPTNTYLDGLFEIMTIPVPERSLFSTMANITLFKHEYADVMKSTRDNLEQAIAVGNIAYLRGYHKNVHLQQVLESLKYGLEIEPFETDPYEYYGEEQSDYIDMFGMLPDENYPFAVDFVMISLQNAAEVAKKFPRSYALMYYNKIIR